MTDSPEHENMIAEVLIEACAAGHVHLAVDRGWRRLRRPARHFHAEGSLRPCPAADPGRLRGRHCAAGSRWRPERGAMHGALIGASPMKWYKHDPAAFLEGVTGLTAQERGFYITLINLLYARDGHAVRDELVCSAMGCNPRNVASGKSTAYGLWKSPRG